MKDVDVKLNEFYFAIIEGEDENGNVIYGEKQKLDGAESLSIEIE